MGVVLRELRAIQDLREVMALERAIWGMDDEELVPASLLLVAVKCGALVIGAFAQTALVGFAYSFPGERHGRPMHWSHMTGVVEGWRARGVGRELKLRQRERVLAQGRDLIEWTFDPLQAPNARFNLTGLGVTVREYIVDAYGTTSSPLHGAVPTDRFVAQWWLTSRRVAEAISGGCREAGTAAGAGTHEGVDLNPVRFSGGWCHCSSPDLPEPGAPWLVNVPPDFTRMLAEAPDVAGEWRLCSRRVFEHAFGCGYAVTGFEPGPRGGGRYLLTREDQAP